MGVSNLGKSRHFYGKGLGFPVSKSSKGDIVFFKTQGAILALYPRALLAEDALVPAKGSGFRGVTLAQNVQRKRDVALVLKQAEEAGGKIVKPAQDVFWGGHSGYFADPDGHLWEVAWNPHFKMDKAGNLMLP